MVSISRRRALGMFGVAATSAALPRGGRGQEGRPSIVIAVPTLPTSNTVDPWNEMSIVGERMLVPNIWEGLIQQDLSGDLALRPSLATAWKVIDDTTVELVLRRGVLFHNGDEMTAEDVAFSFSPERVFGATQPSGGTALVPPGASGAAALQLPDYLPSLGRSIWPSLAGVEVVDGQTVRFRNTIPDAALLGRLAAGGAVASRRAWNEAAGYADWARQPVTTAPYRVVDFQPNVSLTLAAFDGYWGGRPPLERITWVEVPEPSSRVNGLLAGDYDFACDIPPDQLATVEADPSFEIRGGPVQNHRIVVFNLQNAVIANPLVRRAMSHAIDRKAIIDALWAGRTAEPAGLQFLAYKATGMFVDGWSNPAYDPDLARALLAEAGYAGEPIQFPLFNNYYVNQVANGQILAEMWKQVGLNVEIPMTDNWDQMVNAPATGLFDWSNSSTWADPVAALGQNFGPGSFIQPKIWTNAEFNGLCATLETGTDPALRKATFARMLEIAEREDPAYMVLHQSASFTGVRKDIAWRPSPTFAMDFRPANWG